MAKHKICSLDDSIWDFFHDEEHTSKGICQKGETSDAKLHRRNKSLTLSNLERF